MYNTATTATEMCKQLLEKNKLVVIIIFILAEYRYHLYFKQQDQFLGPTLVGSKWACNRYTSSRDVEESCARLQVLENIHER